MNLKKKKKNFDLPEVKFKSVKRGEGNFIKALERTRVKFDEFVTQYYRKVKYLKESARKE